MTQFSNKYPNLSAAFKEAAQDLGQHLIIETMITGATVALAAMAGAAVLPILIGAAVGCAADDFFSSTLTISRALRRSRNNNDTTAVQDEENTDEENNDEDAEQAPALMLSAEDSRLRIAFRAATRGLGQHLVVEAAIVGATAAVTAASGGSVVPVIAGALITNVADDVISSTTRAIRALRMR